MQKESRHSETQVTPHLPLVGAEGDTGGQKQEETHSTRVATPVPREEAEESRIMGEILPLNETGLSFSAVCALRSCLPSARGSLVSQDTGINVTVPCSHTPAKPGAQLWEDCQLPFEASGQNPPPAHTALVRPCLYSPSPALGPRRQSGCSTPALHPPHFPQPD